MLMMEFRGFRISLVFVFVQELVRVTSAATCSYVTSNGVQRYTFCMQKCCGEGKRTYSNVCCPYGDDKEVYMGAGMATLIVLSVFAICFTYVCCKQRLRRVQQCRSRASSSQRTSRSQEGSRDAIPTVSLQVEPIQPPAYEALPPPYYALEPSTSNKKELPEFDDGPPPAYTP